MPFSDPPQSRLTREAFVSLQRESRAVSDERLDDALTLLDGIDPLTGETDADLINDLVRQRYAIGIRANSDGSFSEYTHQDVQQAIYSGGLERISVRTYRRIAEATATLFSQHDQSWDLGGEEKEKKSSPERNPIKPPTQTPEQKAWGIPASPDSGGPSLDWEGEPEEEDEDQKTLVSLRERARFDVSMVRADRIAVALGSCLVRVLWRSGRLVYEAVPPQCVYLGYGQSLADESESKADADADEGAQKTSPRRSVDTSEIEDASVVAIKLPRVSSEDSSSAENKTHYVAYFGRSEGYPTGRCVEYLSDEWWHIPEPGLSGIIYEHAVGGKIANPLTALQDQLGPEACPWEYPVTVIYGTDSPQVSALPLHGLSLYDACLELDLAWSRMLACAHRAASKTAVLTRTEASNVNPPSCIEGAVALSPGENLEWKGNPAADVESATNVIGRLARTLAEAWNVPGYMVLDDETATQPTSGVALAIRTQPMINHRNMRERINRASVMRLFDLERCIVQAATGKEPWPADTELTWYPGRLVTPRNELELLQQLQLGITAKVIDTVDAIKEYHQFATDKEAEEYARKIAKRSREVPTASSTGARGFGGIVPGAARGAFGQQPLAPGQEQEQGPPDKNAPSFGKPVPK